MTNQTKANTIVVGDFNAHIGKKDIPPGDAQLIGPNLFHEQNLLHLTGFRLKNSFESSKSISKT